MSSSNRTFSFFIWSFLLSWSLWLFAIGSRTSISQPAAFFPYLLGGFGPSVAALLLLSREADYEERKSFWARTTSLRGIPPEGWGFLLLFPPLLLAGSLGAHVLTGGGLPSFTLLDVMRRQPLILVSLISMQFIFGPVSEELGWRGYAQELLEDRLGPLSGTLLLGVLWAVWHIPLFFIPGTVQYAWQPGSAAFWLYLLNYIPQAFLYAWLYRVADRSILAVILLHFNLNLMLSVSGPLPDRVEVARLALTVLTALLVLSRLSKGEALESESNGEADWPAS